MSFTSTTIVWCCLSFDSIAISNSISASALLVRTTFLLFSAMSWGYYPHVNLTFIFRKSWGIFESYECRTIPCNDSTIWDADGIRANNALSAVKSLDRLGKSQSGVDKTGERPPHFLYRIQCLTFLGNWGQQHGIIQSVDTNVLKLHCDQLTNHTISVLQVVFLHSHHIYNAPMTTLGQLLCHIHHQHHHIQCQHDWSSTNATITEEFLAQL